MGSTSIVRPVIDFSALIADRTQGFSGRGWVLEAVGRWLTDPNGQRIFLLTGDPGTGKTAVAARIVQLHEGDPAAGSVPGLGQGALAAWHFCQAGRDETLSPREFVESLAQQLANRFPDYRRALEQQGATQYHIAPMVHVDGDVQAGGQAIGGQFDVRIQILSGDARPLFDQMLRRPLRQLYAAGQRTPVTILVDSLDEALWFDPDSNIAQILRLVEDFPPQVRFLMTCRANNRRVFELVGPPTLDLIADAPPGVDEVRGYAQGRLAGMPEPACSQLAERIAQMSKGNFLYARHVLREIESAGLDAAGAALLELPDSLEDVYRQSIKRGLAATPTRWHDAYRPLLGLIAVARGDGLKRTRLIEVTGLAEDVADDVLATCSEYLVGGEDEQPYRIYHQSFRDFLLNDREYGVVAHERHAALARFLELRFGGSWTSCSDDYALRYTAAHWAEAALLAEPKREERVRALVGLLGQPSFQKRFERRVRDLGELQQHWLRAVAAAARVERAEGLPWLLRAAQGHVAFRHEFLQGDSVIKLAVAGELSRAEARLRLFSDIGEDWQKAARLIIAWLGAAVDRAGAERLLEQVMVPGEDAPLLVQFAQRLGAELGLKAEAPLWQAPQRSLDFAQNIVRRMGGQDFDREMLMSLGPQAAEMLDGVDFAAKTDAPVLVRAALDFGADGTALVDGYVDAHAGYSYVEYRNRSLWIVLEAVLRLHPDREWVRERLAHILAAALAGGGADFCEMLPLAAKLLAAPDAPAVLAAAAGAAMNATQQLSSERGRDDPWGTHRRRITALFELAALVLKDDAIADPLLQQIERLPGGFAGFQAPAQLRVADALWATGRPSHPARQRMLDEALKSAHHVQDFHFCARVTARCNALRRWHATPLNGAALAATIRRFAESPAAADYAAEHVVHEAYTFRQHGAPGTLPVEEATRAETLEQLAELLQRPTVEFRRVNPELPLDQPIPGGTPVRVPDPGFAPLLAVHFAARCMAQGELEDERAALVRSLVPVAVANPTALDSVLGYLLIAVRPDSRPLLDELLKQATSRQPSEPPVPATVGIPS